MAIAKHLELNTPHPGFFPPRWQLPLNGRRRIPRVNNLELTVDGGESSVVRDAARGFRNHLDEVGAARQGDVGEFPIRTDASWRGIRIGFRAVRVSDEGIGSGPHRFAQGDGVGILNGNNVVIRGPKVGVAGKNSHQVSDEAVVERGTGRHQRRIRAVGDAVGFLLARRLEVARPTHAREFGRARHRARKGQVG